MCRAVRFGRLGEHLDILSLSTANFICKQSDKKEFSPSFDPELFTVDTIISFILNAMDGGGEERLQCTAVILGIH